MFEIFTHCLVHINGFCLLRKKQLLPLVCEAAFFSEVTVRIRGMQQLL